MSASARFLLEVARFKAWAGLLPAGRGGEWECDYEHWPELHAAFVDFLNRPASEGWSTEETRAILYAVARDNEAEFLAKTMARYPRHLLAAARASIDCPEPDAKWQLAGVLATADPISAHPVLQALADDTDEYVRRRALLDLGRIRSPLVDALAVRAWATGDEYQRIAALHALHDAGSALLADFLEQAEADGRRYLVENAQRLREKQLSER